MIEQEILSPVSQDAATLLSVEMDELLGQISAHELRLSHSYARLGSLLWKVEKEQFWISYGFDRFSSYLKFIGEKIDRRRSQLYGYLAAAETLLPHLSEAKMEEIGITKSYQLQRLVKGGGRTDAEIILKSILPEIGDEVVRIMDYASRPEVTAAQLRIKVNELLHVHEAPQGLWYELNGFYATSDERKEIEGFWELGRRVLQLTSESEHEIRKEVFLAAVRESISTWSVNEPQ